MQLCQNYTMFLLVLYPPPPYFEAEYCLFCGRRRVAVARYRMICFVLMKIYFNLLPKTLLYYAKLYFTTQILLHEKYIFLPKIKSTNFPFSM